jgi:MFS family permease
MIIRYIGLIVAGLISMVLVWFFGIAGMYSLNLAILLHFLPKRDPDEREKQLIARVFNITFVIAGILLINIYILSQFVTVGAHLGQIWVGLLISGFFILLGAVGLIVFHNE